MTRKTGPDEAIEVHQLVRASIETTFAAWTDPDHVLKWWRPTTTTTCTLCEIDLRVGGGYRVHMHESEDQTTCKVHGEFLEVSPPRRLVYTWNAETHQGNVANAVVTVEFHSRGKQQTEIVLRHTGLPDTPVRQGHQETWEKMLISFDTHVHT